MKKKTYSSKEVRSIFKQMDDIFDQEIKFHSNTAAPLVAAEKTRTLDPYSFIEGLMYARKYIAKQYYDTVLKDMTDDEFVSDQKIKIH